MKDYNKLVKFWHGWISPYFSLSRDEEMLQLNSRYSLKQSDAKQNQIVWSPAFSRVCTFLLYSEYSLVFEAGMGRSHYFGFDFTIFDR